MGKESTHLSKEQKRLTIRIEYLESQGMAEPNCWLSVSRRKGKKGTLVYWRLNRKTSAGTATEHLGGEDSEKYQEVKGLVDRRNEVTELRSQLHLVEQCLERQRNWEG